MGGAAAGCGCIKRAAFPTTPPPNHVTRCLSTSSGPLLTLPGVILPLFSASSIIASPMRSLTEEQGCMLSSLASTVAGAPSVTLLSLSSGVLPAGHGGRLQGVCEGAAEGRAASASAPAAGTARGGGGRAATYDVPDALRHAPRADLLAGGRGGSLARLLPAAMGWGGAPAISWAPACRRYRRPDHRTSGHQRHPNSAAGVCRHLTCQTDPSCSGSARTLRLVTLRCGQRRQCRLGKGSSKDRFVSARLQLNVLPACTARKDCIFDALACFTAITHACLRAAR